MAAFAAICSGRGRIVDCNHGVADAQTFDACARYGINIGRDRAQCAYSIAVRDRANSGHDPPALRALATFFVFNNVFLAEQQ